MRSDDDERPRVVVNPGNEAKPDEPTIDVICVRCRDWAWMRLPVAEEAGRFKALPVCLPCAKAEMLEEAGGEPDTDTDVLQRVNPEYADNHNALQAIHRSIHAAMCSCPRHYMPVGHTVN